jgi:hypothetical protein
LFGKTLARDVDEITKGMSVSEKKFYLLGAKQDIFDRIANLRTNANSVDRLFGKNGDVNKLKSLFDDDTAFKKFHDSLKIESEFAKTKAELGNSTTFKQHVDSKNAAEALDIADASTGSPAAASRVLGRVLGKLSKAGSAKEKEEALELVGDILLSKGMSGDRIRELLKQGSSQRIAEVLRNALKKDLTTRAVGDRAIPVAAGLTKATQENRQENR